MHTLRKKIENVIQEIDRIKLNILGLAEIRWKGADSMKLGSKILICSGRHTHERGFGILFDVTRAKSLGSSAQFKIEWLQLNWYPLNLEITQVFAPTSDNEDVEVEQFYKEIEKAKGCLKSQDIIILMGDFNANVGDERVEDVGPSGMGTVNVEVG
ncbi:craniofacial development protein 2-like protein [Plakobranchus ocellatus]|uniref:Craniofacial development protein 2-like protein n=1 Tax=Plakobranchus ocellatus TaxID=259542 RepID=A0AAV3Y2R7_9GAST|nr:craniofacial development protein 2-like protein [Plakobranchus ocellatus]